jgi:hypothetical protein
MAPETLALIERGEIARGEAFRLRRQMAEAVRESQDVLARERQLREEVGDALGLPHGPARPER